MNLLARLQSVMDGGDLLTDAAACAVYARDASHLELGLPAAVVLPRTEAEVGRVLAVCAELKVPVVCRGTGTGLSGGALPPDGGVVLGLSRLDEVGAVDPDDRRVRVGSGVLNARVSARATVCGLEFAPDPSSQSASTIGGNIAENAGGPHCLLHGVTLSHVLGMRWCDAAGRSHTTGRGVSAERGFGLASLLCGSEGTLGVVTAADLALVPVGEATGTLLAVFPVLDDAVGSVANLVQSGLLPVAVEIVDRTMLQAVEEAFGFGFPTDVEAAMIVEFSGPAAAVDADTGRARLLLQDGGAREVTLAADAGEREALWLCRKKAFGAVGRLAPRYVTMDVVAPLGKLPTLVRDIQRIKAEHGVEIATAFHAGDGNLHPGIHYDDREPDSTRRAHAAADAIIMRALELGGSCTGEHGVGIEKLHVVPRMLDQVTAALQWGIKDLFDPGGILNPGKMLPPPQVACAPVKPLPAALRIDWDSLTVTAPAALPVAEMQAALMARGLWVPVGAWLPRQAEGPGLVRAGTVAEMIDQLLPGPGLGAWGTVRDVILELWAETGDGRLCHAGAPVFKNVAGYALPQALCGAGGAFARPLAATFQVRPLPPALGVWVCEHRQDAADRLTLAPLLQTVRAHQGIFPGKVAILESDGQHLRGPLVILAPGRDAPWDLGALAAELKMVREKIGCRCLRHEVLPFVGGVGCLIDEGVLPAWVAGAPTWTMLTARPGADTAAVGGMPWAARKVLCQFTPRVCWSPEAAVSDPDWHADVVWQRGEATALPPPGPGVPVDVLRGLKRLFDPAGALPGPGWLQP